MSTNDPLIGRTISGKYRVLQKIGAGGQSRVYKAQELNLNRMVALKCIVEDIEPDSEQAIRFAREAQDLARLRHPNVVTVFESGNDGNIFYIAMEFLDGLNLSQIVKKNGPLNEKAILAYMAPLADALDHIHNSDLVHSDIKSSNIIIDRSGRPVLMDLGIAIQTDKTVLDSGNILGTPEFMSPEQSRGEAIDERSDLYSLGVVMYEALVGRVPFHGRNYAATTHMVINQPPVPPVERKPELSQGINQLILHLLSKNKQDRIPTALELSRILKQMLHPPQEEKTAKKAKTKAAPKTKKEAKPKAAPKPKRDTVAKKTPAQYNKKKRLLYSLLILVLIIAILIPVGLYFTDTGTLEPINPPPPGGMTSEEFTALSNKAGEYMKQGDFIMAHRLYSDIRNRAHSSGSISEQYIYAHKEVVQILLGQIQLVAINRGHFKMGSDKLNSSDNPTRDVHLLGFSLSSTEIPMEAYLDFLNALYCDKNGYIENTRVLLTDHHGISSMGLYDVRTNLFAAQEGISLPAFGVTYSGAKMFCEFVGGRLPTEAEWEFAAKASGSSTYSGAETPETVAWYRDNAPAVQAVAALAPNELGIYDMSGNVWEWCADFYAEDTYLENPAINPTGPESGQLRVIRGGDILSEPFILESSYRSAMAGNSLTRDFIGFRLCK